MSFGGQTNQTSGVNSDPNNFSNTGRNFGAETDGPLSNQGYGHEQPAFGGNTSDINTFGAGGGDFTGRERGAFGGNTTDANTFGAGGDFTGRDNGRLGDQDWETASTGQQAYSGNTTDALTAGTGTAGKPKAADKLKGTMEQMTGKLTGNPTMVERGQARKTGDFDNNF